MEHPIPADYVFSPHLPPAAVAALRQAEPSVWGQEGAMAAAFKAVRYPRSEVGPRADMLDPAQRAVAEFITEHDLTTMDNDRDQWMPGPRTVRRRWLGLDPPGALESPITFVCQKKTCTEPLWRAIRMLDAAGETAAQKKLVAALPLGRRLQIWGEINEGKGDAYGLHAGSFFSAGSAASYDQLQDEGRDWAPGYADSRLGLDTETDERFPLFLSLVRSGIPIEPRWYPLLPIGVGVFEPLMRECLAAIPEAERGTAVAAAMATDHPAHSFSTALLLLSQVPGPAIAAEVLRHLKPSDRGKVKKLQQAARGNPAALALINTFAGTLPAAIKLIPLRERKSLSPADLSELDRQQILVAGRRYHGRKVSLARLLDSDPDSELSLLHTLEYRSLGDPQSHPVYDAWLYMGDSGSIFEAGTINPVASVIQGDANSNNPALDSALQGSLWRKIPASTPAAGKKAPGAKAAKKPAARGGVARR